MNLIFGFITLVTRRGWMPALILAVGWYGGAKYGAPDLVINAIDGVIARGGAIISPLLGRTVEEGGEIAADAVEEGSDYVVGTVEGFLEDLAKPAAQSDEAAPEEEEAPADETADGGDQPVEASVAPDDPDLPDDAAAGAPPAAATPMASGDGNITLCNTNISNSPGADANGVVRPAGATVRKNNVTLLLMPATKSCLSSGYGLRNGKLHKGIDYYSDTGGDVLAAGDGVIRRRVTRSDFGNMLVIDHGDGVFTRYAHLAAYGSGVSEGARVSAGQVLGPIGNTGASSIVHLHYEILTGEWASQAGSFGLDPVDPFSLPAGN